MIDAYSGFWQTETDERDRGKAAFTSQHGRFKFVQMLFSLKNVSTTVQWAMDVILSSLKWQSASVYLDDIVVLFEERQQSYDALPRSTDTSTRCRTHRQVKEVLITSREN